MVNETPAKVGDMVRSGIWRVGALMTLAGAVVQLNTEGITTATGAPWSANAVAKVQKRLNAYRRAEAALAA
jgi:hypothetical protein